MRVADLERADHLHHAYIVTGEGAAPAVSLMLITRGVTLTGNPDVLQLQYGDMGVDDARSIASYAFLKSVGEGKYFIISFDKAGDGAQNALLKVVEEAPGNTHFFFCTQSLGGILPTLRSRCIAVRGDASKTDPEASPLGAAEFLASGYADRLAKVDKLVSAAQKSQDRAPIRAFVRDLLVAAHTAHTTPSGLRTLVEADRYLALSGSSPKVVLSHLAVVLPSL